LWVILALLDPDPDSEYGSGSTDPIEYGSNTDPDPGSGSTTLPREITKNKKLLMEKKPGTKRYGWRMIKHKKLWMENN
jgi:hypothetical protein